ncbi:uncharacterized protein LOC144664023 [Oculina patagonica]
MAAAFVSRLILRRSSRLCFSNVIRQSTLSSSFSCNVFYKEKKSSVRNSCESFQKHDGLLSPTSQKFTSGYVSVGVCFGLVLGAVFATTSANNANCAGKEDSSAPCDDQEEENVCHADEFRDASAARFKFRSIFDAEKIRKVQTKRGSVKSYTKHESRKSKKKTDDGVGRRQPARIKKSDKRKFAAKHCR